jgi:hypothetical protein
MTTSPWHPSCSRPPLRLAIPMSSESLMSQTNQPRPYGRAWRVFLPREGRRIELQLQVGQGPCCPGCRQVLEARPTTRFTRALPLGARGYDLDCRGCRRFWCVVRHTPRSIRILRMRRFVAAVRAAEPGLRLSEAEMAVS